MRVVIVESAAQARAAADAAPGATPLALTPEAIWALEQSGSKFHTDDELVSDEVFQAICAASAPRAAALAAALDGIAGRPLDRPVFALLDRELKRLIEGTLGRAAILDAALERLGATQVARFEPEPVPPSPVLEWAHTSPWAPVVPSVCARRGVADEVVGGPSASGVYALHGLARWQRVEAWPRRAARLLRERHRVRRGRSGNDLDGATVALVAVA